MLCPQCKTEQTKRVDGSCPNCGVSVSIHNGAWYRTSIGAPTTHLVEVLERHVSDAMSKEQGIYVPFRYPRKSAQFRKELVVAERLLNLADNDMDLLERAIEIQFNDKRFMWRSKTSLFQVEYDIITTLAIARAQLAEAAKAQVKQTTVISSISERTKLFNDS